MMIIFRTRKVSVFYNKLGHVDEDEEHHDNDDEDKDYSDLAADDEDEDYAFPLDAIKEESVSLYENPHQPIRDQDPSSGPIRSQDDNGDRIQERIVGTEVSISPPQQRSPTNTHLGDRRKLSLGVILRKLSTGTKGKMLKKQIKIYLYFQAASQRGRGRPLCRRRD